MPVDRYATQTSGTGITGNLLFSVSLPSPQLSVQEQMLSVITQLNSVFRNIIVGFLTLSGEGQTIPAFASNIDLQMHKAINLASPTQPTDAVPKHYVDDLITSTQKQIAAQGLSLNAQPFYNIKSYSVTINPAAIGPQTTSEQTFTVTGLSTADKVFVNKPTHTTGVGLVNARVSATNTIAITFMNTTTGAAGIDPPSESYLIVAIRS